MVEMVTTEFQVTLISYEVLGDTPVMGLEEHRNIQTTAYGPFPSQERAERCRRAIRGWMTRRGWSRCTDGSYQRGRYDGRISIKKSEVKRAIVS